MKSYQLLGISLSWGGQSTSRGIYINGWNVINLNLLASSKKGVHMQIGLGIWRMEASFGLGWWEDG